MLPWLLVACAALWATAAAAHKASDAYLTLEMGSRQDNPGQVSGPLSQRLDIHLRDLDRELDLDANADGALSWGEVRGRWPEIQALATRDLLLSFNGAPCLAQAWEAPSLDRHSDGTYAVLRARLRCADSRSDASANDNAHVNANVNVNAVNAVDAVHRSIPPNPLQVTYRLFEHSDPGHRGIVRLRLAGQRPDQGLAAVLVPGVKPQQLPLPVVNPGAPGHASVGLPTSWAGGEWQRFASFWVQGVHHILIGLDHLLFLLALLLPAVLVRTARGWQAAAALRPVILEVLKLVSAFTLAHSITLTLAVLDVLNPPSRWVESLIAASVVLAALNNLRPMLGARPWIAAFAFGLVHGFGFAGALKDIGLGSGSLALPLIGFNLGVEMGQLALVALFVPLAWVWRAQWAYRGGLMQGGSAAIALLALVWLTERLLNLNLLPSA